MPTCRAFSKRDQARLALLVLGQRGKLQKLAAMPAAIRTGAWCSVFAWPCFCIVRAMSIPSRIVGLEDPVGFQLDLPVGWQEPIR
jgi:exopolyphosphatase/guanosine-5'-triphosphate,3'-diphosphate pyrophosphatase